MKKSRNDLFDNAESRLRYEAYSRLQASAVVFGESLPIPEIVAIGGQSDGKSSLLEAFLGFRFNVREVEMGTRRPLIVQMIHDPSATEPRCRFQDEDSDEYGPPVVPETAVADAIQRRTEELLRKTGGAVSSKPIVMRAEYAYCSNLTIVDTPGFILKAREGETNSTPEEIMNMVKEQAAPPHRLILFLQQSSVEWASSLWLRVIQEVDPNFQRTIIVASKFDNRLKEFQERWEVDKYLSATGYLPSNVKPFFVALPKDRAVTSSAEWRRQMQEVDFAIFRHMRENISGGFDEDRFGGRIGFTNLKRFLEEELARRYRKAAPATLALLQERCEAVAAELMTADTRLRSAEDVCALRKSGMRHAAAVSSLIVTFLNGCTDPDPMQHGMTTEEERAASRTPQWPGVTVPVQPHNHDLKLFGRAAFVRCVHEFQEAAQSLKFPTVVQAKVANVLLAYRDRNNLGGAALAAQDIARQTARELLGPLLDTACSRLAFVVRRVFDIAADRAMQSATSKEALQPYVAFHAALRSAHHSVLSKVEEDARKLVRHHLDAGTSEFAVNMLLAHAASGPYFGDEDLRGGALELDAIPEDDSNENRDINLPLQNLHMAVPDTPSPGVLANGGDLKGPGRHMDDSPSKPRLAKAHRTGRAVATSLHNSGHGMSGTYEDVCRQAERLFGHIRKAVAQQAAPTTLKAAFLEPIKDKLALDVSLDLFGRNDAEFMNLFTAAGALSALKAKRDALQKRVEALIKSKNEFHELAKCI